jgi:hypothetical protein
LSQQGTNREFQVAIVNFLVRTIVGAIAYFKLQIANNQIFICIRRPYNVQKGISAYQKIVLSVPGMLG